MKNLLRYLAFVLMVGGAYAQSNLPACHGTTYSVNWNNCFGEFGNNPKYVGEFKDGRLNGQGTETLLNGDKYDGEFRDGKRNGRGTYTFANGSVISQGIWADGNFVGLSPNQQSNLPACQGSDAVMWTNNCFGTYTYANGNKYVGEFKDGKRNGQGTNFLLADNQWKGDKYVGGFKDGKFHGQGTYFHLAENEHKGNKYVGEYRDDKRTGQGTYFHLADNPRKGDKYVGEFKDGNAHGQGTYYTSSNGYKFVGEYKDGQRSGIGTLYASNGSVINQGIWTNGNLVSSIQLQQATTTNAEIERQRTEAEQANRRQAEAEEQLRLSQQQPQTNTPRASAPSIGKRVALVVGNANYKVRPLKNPRNDADDISRSLRSSGFEVIDLRDASLQQMRNGVRQFGDRLINNDVGLVYYSGHGVEVKGRNYFIPVNADIQREDEIADQGLDVSLILEKMNTAGKGVNILIVDACRDDPFGRSFRSSSRGLAQMDAPRGTIIAYATSPGKVASDGDPRERNSPYTKNLVKAMQQPNKPIEQVFKEVRRAVQEETKNQQTPWENTSLSGDFYFRVQR
jgi:hypothetical protein